MDLRGLMGSKEGPGQHKGGGRKEDLKKSYKKPGTSTDEARSLRTIHPWLGLQIYGCDFSEVSTSDDENAEVNKLIKIRTKVEKCHHQKNQSCRELNSGQPR